MKTAPRTARWLVLLFLLAAFAGVSAGTPGGGLPSKDAAGCSRVFDSDFNDMHFAYSGCARGGGGCYHCYYNTGGTLSECYETPDGSGTYCWETDYQDW
jgi:hypothetical protein